MKDLHLIVWLTQLGLTTALPLAGFILLAVWLQDHFGWGNWVIWVGVIVGICCAVDGFRNSLRIMARLNQDKPSEDPPSVSFNDHD